jgi:hypothetical protein
MTGGHDERLAESSPGHHCLNQRKALADPLFYTYFVFTKNTPPIITGFDLKLEVGDRPPSKDYPMKTLFQAFTLLFIGSSSLAYDFTGMRDSIIRVDQSTTHVRYTFCSVLTRPETCRVLGKDQWYKKRDLAAVRRGLYLKDAGNILVAPVAGWATVILAGMTVVTPNPGTAILTLAAGGLVRHAIYDMYKNTYITPLLNEKTLNDIDQDSDFELEVVAKHLEALLNTL